MRSHLRVVTLPLRSDSGRGCVRCDLDASKATLDHSTKEERRVLGCSKPSRTASVDAIEDDALDKTLESSFSPSDPPAGSLTRVGKPKRLR